MAGRDTIGDTLGLRVRVDIPELLPDLCAFLEGRGYDVVHSGGDEAVVRMPQGPRDFRAAVTLLADLEEFVNDHRLHGTLTGDATEPGEDGYLLTVACPCGVAFERWVTPEMAQEELLHTALQAIWN